MKAFGRRLGLFLLAGLALAMAFQGDRVPEREHGAAKKEDPGFGAAWPKKGPRGASLGGGRRLVTEGEQVYLVEPDGTRVPLGRLGASAEDTARLPPLPATASTLYPPKTNLASTQLIVTPRGLVTLPASLLVTLAGDDHVMAFDPLTRRATTHYVNGRVEGREK